LLLCAAPLAFAADPKSPVTVRVDWINYEQLQCKGCRTQLITMNADSYCVIGQEAGQRILYAKISNHWIGNSIQVSVTAEARRDDGTFKDGEGKSVIVAGLESKALRVGDVKFLVSAAKATEAELRGPVGAKKPPNHSPDPTPASLTSAEGQPPRQQ
jgi:hypothetical protein